MSKASSASLGPVVYVVVGLFAAMVVGFFTFYGRFFQLPRPMLPFLVVGFTGGLIYVTVQLRRVGLAILLIGLLYLTQVAMTPPMRTSTLAAAAIFALPVGFALLAGSYAQQAISRFKIGRFVVMGAIVALGYGLMMVLFLIRSRFEFDPKLVLRQALVGLELGGAMGLGFELVELIGPRLAPVRGRARD